MTKTKKIIVCIVAAVMVVAGTVLGIVFAPRQKGKQPENFAFVVQANLTLEVGQSALLNYSVLPLDAEVAFTSSAPNVATFDSETKMVTALAAGTATINGVAIFDGETKFANCLVTVTDKNNPDKGDEGNREPETTTYRYTLTITNGDGHFDEDSNTLFSYEDYIQFTIQLFDNENNEIFTQKISTDPKINQDGHDSQIEQLGYFMLYTTLGGDLEFNIDDGAYAFTIHYQKIEKL